MAGKVTRVVVKQNGLNLRVNAVAKQSGKYGEFINLYNPMSKKQIRGQVIGINEVRVDI